MDMRSNNLKTFTALQGHFTRDARDQAGDSIMCIVVADFSDMMLRDMISRYVFIVMINSSSHYHLFICDQVQEGHSARTE